MFHATTTSSVGAYNIELELNRLLALLAADGVGATDGLRFVSFGIETRVRDWNWNWNRMNSSVSAPRKQQLDDLIAVEGGHEGVLIIYHLHIRDTYCRRVALYKLVDKSPAEGPHQRSTACRHGVSKD
jgi:hypothetical protein